MPQPVYERLEILIDPEINWRIDKYDSKTNEDLDERSVFGVCHEVSVDIGSVEWKQPIFVVEYCNNNLILGCP